MSIMKLCVKMKIYTGKRLLHTLGEIYWILCTKAFFGDDASCMQKLVPLLRCDLGHTISLLLPKVQWTLSFRSFHSRWMGELWHHSNRSFAPLPAVAEHGTKDDWLLGKEKVGTSFFFQNSEEITVNYLIDQICSMEPHNSSEGYQHILATL